MEEEWKEEEEDVVRAGDGERSRKLETGRGDGAREIGEGRSVNRKGRGGDEG